MQIFSTNNLDFCKVIAYFTEQQLHQYIQIKIQHMIIT